MVKNLIPSSSNKKVLFFNSNIAWGGGEKWHLNMAIELQQKGYRTAILGHQKGKLIELAQTNNIQILEQRLTNLSFLNLIKLFQIWLQILRFSPQVIILNLPRDVKICGILKLFIPQVKLIYRRGMPHPIKRTLLNRFIMNQMDHLIANSQEIKNSLVQNIPELKKKIHVIYNGVTPRQGHSHQLSVPIRLGNLGRLVEQKGQKHH